MNTINLRLPATDDTTTISFEQTKKAFDCGVADGQGWGYKILSNDVVIGSVYGGDMSSSANIEMDGVKYLTSRAADILDFKTQGDIIEFIESRFSAPTLDSIIEKNDNSKIVTEKELKNLEYHNDVQVLNEFDYLDDSYRGIAVRTAYSVVIEDKKEESFIDEALSNLQKEGFDIRIDSETNDRSHNETVYFADATTGFKILMVSYESYGLDYPRHRCYPETSNSVDAIMDAFKDAFMDPNGMFETAKFEAEEEKKMRRDFATLTISAAKKNGFWRKNISITALAIANDWADRGFSMISKKKFEKAKKFNAWSHVSNILKDNFKTDIKCSLATYMDALELFSCDEELYQNDEASFNTISFA